MTTYQNWRLLFEQQNEFPVRFRFSFFFQNVGPQCPSLPSPQAKASSQVLSSSYLLMLFYRVMNAPIKLTFTSALQVFALKSTKIPKAGQLDSSKNALTF